METGEDQEKGSQPYSQSNGMLRLPEYPFEHELNVGRVKKRQQGHYNSQRQIKAIKEVVLQERQILIDTFGPYFSKALETVNDPMAFEELVKKVFISIKEEVVESCLEVYDLTVDQQKRKRTKVLEHPGNKMLEDSVQEIESRLLALKEQQEFYRKQNQALEASLKVKGDETELVEVIEVKEEELEEAKLIEKDMCEEIDKLYMCDVKNKQSVTKTMVSSLVEESKNLKKEIYRGFLSKISTLFGKPLSANNIMKQLLAIH